MKRQASQSIKYMCVLGGLLLLSCSAPYRRFSVDGVADDFCVPNAYATAYKAWTVLQHPDPQGRPTVGTVFQYAYGFSLKGCDSMPENARGSCGLPEQLISTDIVPLKPARPQILRDLNKRSSENFDRNATYTVDPATGLLVVEVPGGWPSWTVWKRRSGDVRDSPRRLHDLDELFVYCSSVEDFPDRSAVDRRYGQYTCQRYVRGPDYALDFSFISKERVPGDLELKRLETTAVAQIDRWRCRK